MVSIIDCDCPIRIKILRHCFNLYKKNKGLFGKIRTKKISDSVYKLIDLFGNTGNNRKIIEQFIEGRILDKELDGIYFNYPEARLYVRESFYMNLAKDFKVLENDVFS